MIFKITKPFYRSLTIILIFSFSLLLTPELMLPLNLWAQSSGEAYMQQGKYYWYNLEPEKAIHALKIALTQNLSAQNRIEAYKLLAFCYAIQRDSNKAKEQFLNILKINPNFALSSKDSPVFLNPFRKALIEFASSDEKAGMDSVKKGNVPLTVNTPGKDNESPEIIHNAISKAEQGDIVIITASVIDNIAVESVRLNYRPKGESDYERLKMDFIGNNYYTASIIDIKDDLEYYITAQDISGNPPCTWKNSKNPQVIAIVRAKKKGNSSFLLIGIGAIVVGGGAYLALVQGKSKDTATPTDDILRDPPPLP